MITLEQIPEADRDRLLRIHVRDRDYTFDDRQKLRVPIDALRSAIDFAETVECPPAPYEYLHQLREQHPDTGLAEAKIWAINALPTELRDDALLDPQFFDDLQKQWDAAADRPFNIRKDSPLIDFLVDMIAKGWPAPPEIHALVAECKRMDAEALAIVEAQDEAELQRRCDAVRAEWLASGETDTLADSPERVAELKAEFEKEWGPLDESKDALWRDWQHNKMIENKMGSNRDDLRDLSKYRGGKGGAHSPPPASGATTQLPLLAGQTIVAELGRTAVETFLAFQKKKQSAWRPGRVSAAPPRKVPSLPASLEQHPLYALLNRAVVEMIYRAASGDEKHSAADLVDTLAVLSAVHQQVFDEVCEQLRSFGVVLPESEINPVVRRFETQVQRQARVGAGYATDTKGNPEASNTDNVPVFLAILGVNLRWNAWSRRIEIQWSAKGRWSAFEERDFNLLLTTAANGIHNFRPRESLLKRTLNALAHEVVYDPVLERIAQAEANWDGVPRLESFLSRALGVPNDAYHTAVSRNLVGGIVKRARRPGAKHDEVVILIGPEDTLKSTFCRALALEDEWFSDSVAFEGSPQNVVPQLFGKLVIELAELDGMARREVQFIKRFLSTQSDSVTLKYEAFSSDHARRCIFIGTSNEQNPLRGDTGNRRFLPVRIDRRIDIDFVRYNIEQLIGEAATLESAGERFLIPTEVIPQARRLQEDARAESDFEIHLQEWFDGVGENAYISAADLAVLLKDATGRSIAASVFGNAMRRLGFKQAKIRTKGTQIRVWLRGDIGNAQRFSVSRSHDGRAFPRLISIVPPPPPI